MEHVHLLEVSTYPELPKLHTPDCVFAVVLNEVGEALVLERAKSSKGGVCWQMMGGHLNLGEDPFTAVQRQLLAIIGYHTTRWSYLGSHVSDGDSTGGAGYFFCAQQASSVTGIRPNEPDGYVIKWVSLTDLRYALLDGRITIMSHALTVSLALLTTLK